MSESDRAGDSAFLPSSARVSRRSLLRGGAGAGALFIGGSLLAACGSSKSSSTGTGTGTAASSSATQSSGTSSAAPSSGVGAQIRELLGIPTGKAAGEGMTIKLGGDYALSGIGTNYGLEQYHGVLFGITHVKAAGGPNFELVVRNTPGEQLTSAGASNTREFGSQGIPIVISSQGGGGGAGAPFYASFKMMAIDSGGAQKANEGKPYLYQGRGEFNAGFMPTLIAYNKAKRPQVKRVSILSYDFSGPQADINTGTVSALKEAGYAVGDPVLVQFGATDFSSAFSKLRQQNPQLIVSTIVEGADAGVMLKQYLTAGIQAQIINMDYTPQYAVLAGPTAIKNFEFCFDYFNAEAPGNDWAKLFVDEWVKSHGGTKPIYYNANYYQSVFFYWDLVRRIIAAGGDPTKQGTAYVDAFAKNVNFASVYGSPGAKHGTEVYNAATHTVSRKQIAYGQALADGTATIYATADITGSGFALTAAGKTAPSDTKLRS